MLSKTYNPPQSYYWILLDLLGFFAALLILVVVPADVATPLIYVLVLIYLLVFRRIADVKRMGLATIIGVTWMIFAKDMYQYVGSFYTVAGINIFPLFAVPIALMGIWVLYQAVSVFLASKSFHWRIGLFTIFVNWPVLILVEYLGYHWLDIQNASTSQYAGLAFCDCLHAPWWMQLTYFAFGPIFFALCYALDLHHTNVFDDQAQEQVESFTGFFKP